MIAKKNPKVDANNKRTLFFEIGMLIAISLVLGAFQIQQGEMEYTVCSFTLEEEIPPELMPITRREQPKPPEPPKPKIEPIIEIIPNSGIDDPDPWFISEDDPTIGITIIEIEEEKPEVEEGPVYFTEVMPSYEGGMKALAAFLQKELKYPEAPKENNVQGKVFVQFVVNKKGAVEQAKVVKGVDPLLDKEAIRVISKMPNWNPGMQNYKAISVYYTIPINFKLN